MENVYIIRTDYYSNPWTWTKRFLMFFIASGFLWWISTIESNDTRYVWIKYGLFGMVSFYIFSKPQDELALDRENLYYIKRSIFSRFNKTIKYKISNIKSVGYAGIYDTDTKFLIKGNSYRNRLEIIFKDDSSKSHDVTIYKRELREIVRQMHSLINRNSA